MNNKIKYIENRIEVLKQAKEIIENAYFKEIIIRDLNRLEEEIKVLKKVENDR